MENQIISTINGTEILTVDRDGEVFVPSNLSAKLSASTSRHSTGSSNLMKHSVQPLSL